MIGLVEVEKKLGIAETFKLLIIELFYKKHLISIKVLYIETRNHKKRDMESSTRQRELADLEDQSNIDEPSNQDWHPGLEKKAEQWPEVKSMTRTMT